jgi:biopolymer transport protein TolR
MHPISESRVVAAPNVTPMIDVMMVLLIIFMVVTPTLLSGVIAEPPVGENLQPRPEDERDHTLAIDIHGAYFLDKRPIRLEDLRPALAALYPATAENRVLYVRAHRELRYRNVVEALEIARGSGVAVVGLVSEQRRRPE